MILTMVTEEYTHRFSNPDRINLNDSCSLYLMSILYLDSYHGRYWMKTLIKKMPSSSSLETDLRLNPDMTHSDYVNFGELLNHLEFEFLSLLNGPS